LPCVATRLTVENFIIFSHSLSSCHVSPPYLFSFFSHFNPPTRGSPLFFFFLFLLLPFFPHTSSRRTSPIPFSSFSSSLPLGSCSDGAPESLHFSFSSSCHTHQLPFPSLLLFSLSLSFTVPTTQRLLPLFVLPL
jgi:hypothetical protein